MSFRSGQAKKNLNLLCQSCQSQQRRLSQPRLNPHWSWSEPKEATKPRIDLAKGAQMFFSENVSRKLEPKPKTIVGMIDEVCRKNLRPVPCKVRRSAWRTAFTAK